ncbi:unnamed protein product [Lactuca virosa]|uniref:Uncharacterized protein n=1 Tax=Lactuca virosa TaxID=75947 RepID=A0AAU9N2U2_9ASTR|nr:unnamed protein product [Lactuca virosa]
MAPSIYVRPPPRPSSLDRAHLPPPTSALRSRHRRQPPLLPTPSNSKTTSSCIVASVFPTATPWSNRFHGLMFGEIDFEPFSSISDSCPPPPLAPLYLRQLQQPCLRFRQLLQGPSTWLVLFHLRCFLSSVLHHRLHLLHQVASTTDSRFRTATKSISGNLIRLTSNSNE